MTDRDMIEDAMPRLEQLARQGYTDKQIAESFGVSYANFRKIKTQSMTIKQTIIMGREKANFDVEQSLFKKAKGFKYKEQQAIKTKVEEKQEDGTILTKEVIEVVTVEKYSAPDVQAQKFWLMNRDKSRWQSDPHKVNNDKEVLKLRQKESEKGDW